jgi:hypothetical protein
MGCCDYNADMEGTGHWQNGCIGPIFYSIRVADAWQFQWKREFIAIEAVTSVQDAGKIGGVGEKGCWWSSSFHRA